MAAERTLGRPLIGSDLTTPIELAVQHVQAVVRAKPSQPHPDPPSPAHLEGRILRVHERLFALFDFVITYRAPAQLACTTGPHERAV